MFGSPSQVRLRQWAHMAASVLLVTCYREAYAVGVSSDPALLTDVTVTISPTSAGLIRGGTQQFTATVTGATNTALVWSTNGGTISNSGLYTAPQAPGIFRVTATSVADQSKTATASVTVTNYEQLQAQSCDRESSLRSLEGATTSSIEFVNFSSQAIQIYWLDYNGRRQFYNTLQPRESYVQATFLTHPWLVTDLNRQCLGIYLPTSKPATAATIEISASLPTPVDTSVITTFAGGFIGDNAPATLAALAFPRYMALDVTGNLFVSDSIHNRIRKIDPSGTITTVVGTGLSGYSGDGGPPTSAMLNFPAGIAFDPLGNLMIADSENNVIRKVSNSGVITTIAGKGIRGYSGDGGPAISASLNGPIGIAFDSAGNLYFADSENNVVRKISTLGIMTTVAGSGTPGFSGDGGPAAVAKLNFPRSVRVDSRGNLVVIDAGNHRVRKVDGTGIITTLAGNGLADFSGDGGSAIGAAIGNPRGVAFDPNGNLLISNAGSGRVRRVDASGIITTIAGSATGFNGDGKPALSTWFAFVSDILFDPGGNMFLTDSGNARIRKVSPSGIVTTMAGGFVGDGGPATSSNLNAPEDIKVDTLGNLYVADTDHHRVRRIDASGRISTVAGTGISGFAGDGGPATSASLYFPLGVAADGNRNVFIADDVYIRKVDPSGVIRTIAGNGAYGYSGDGGLATSASLRTPSSVAIDGFGNVYFADQDSCVVRRILGSGIIETVAGNGKCGFGGDGGTAISAMLDGPAGITLDSIGNLYVADTNNHRVRKVNMSGVIATLAGRGISGFSGDGAAAASASLSFPAGVALDSMGNLYIADNGNS
ncbi:MAG TPA: hypothetical protein VGQ81_13750, partial [Acidobacteriota bacterium]|nr:hypothetical protein [Acidobacteriota bacterium]